MMMNRTLAVATAVCLAAVWGTPALADGGPVPDEPVIEEPAEIEEPVVEEPQAAPMTDHTLGDHAYMTVFGGVSFGEGIDFSLSDGPDIGNVGLDQGFVLGGALGKSFKTSSSVSIRIELEGSFRNHNTDQSDVNIDTSTGDPFLDDVAATVEAAVDPTVVDPDITNDVDVETTAVLANVWLDFDLGMSIVPYVGGGVGAGFVDIENVIGETHESGAGVAYQGGAGLYAKVSENFAIGVHYRYFVADVDTTFRDDVILLPDTEVANKLTSHEISGSITLFF